MTQDLLIRNAYAVDPSTAIDGVRDVLVRGGRVAAVELPGVLPAGPAELDASGLTLAPGLIDVHVHLREPGQTYKETIATGTQAAAAGGFTTVVAMPNTVPVNDSVETLHWMLAPERGAVINLRAMPAATVASMGATLTDFEALAQAGAVGFTDDGKPILGDDMMWAVLVAAARLGLPVSQHAEDTRMTAPATPGGAPCSMNFGPVAFRLGLRGMTVEAESSIVERDLQLLRDIEKVEGLRPHLHVQHVSTGQALSAIRQAKRQGLNVTCEAAPHHFTLTDEALHSYDTHAKMNPPLRSELDRQAVIDALFDGTVDCIATDHAPHAAFEKEVEFERAPNGITGLETALGLTLRMLHKGLGMPLAQIVRLMSTHPAALLKMQDRGNLRAGSYADLVLFAPGTEWSYNAQASLSRSKNSPFDGFPMLGRIHTTLSEGRVVYQRPS